MTDAGTRDAVAGVWAFEPDEGYALFELDIDAALAGERNSPDEWPPRYASWRPGTR